MTRSPVAVILTCYDLGRTLKESLDSALNQTCPPAEILVVDDGSTDDLTRQVLFDVERAGHRVLRITNSGVCAARNTGIRATRSPYIVLLDGDDLLEPSYLEQASGLLDADPKLAFVSCGMSCFGEAEDVWYPDPPDVIDSMVRGVVHVSSMFRRSMWEAVGGFDEQFAAHEEVDFWTRVVERGFRGEILDQALLRYRIRSGSMYESAVDQQRHRVLMQRFYRKHRAMITDHAEKLLAAQERFIIDQRAHHQALGARKRAIQIELGNLEREINQSVKQLELRGVGRIEFGDLRRTSPISESWGQDRGKPLDRYYIESFLERHKADVKGAVLEVKDSNYTSRFGGDRVERAEVVDIDPTNTAATIVADLGTAASLPAERYDCVIFTQTLGLIFDVRLALANLYRSLKPGGVLLCTVPASGRISYEGPGADGDFWRFTEASVRRLFAERFSAENFQISTYGNVLSRAAFLYGLAAHELDAQELNLLDPFFPVTYAIRAVRRGSSGFASISRAAQPAAILMYHRIADGGNTTENMCVSPEHLRAHLSRLRAGGYNLISLGELRRGLDQGSLPARSIALTFDDGYVDALTAATILSEWEVPATMFVVGAALQPGHEHWWDTLDRIWSNGHQLPSTLRLELAGHPVTLPTGTADQRRAAQVRIREVLYTATLDDRDRILNQLLQWSGWADRQQPRLPTLDADGLVKLASVSGIEIGAHSESHLWLPTQTAEVVGREVSRSKHRLDTLLGRRVSSFAYPHGGHDAATIDAVRAAGFDLAVTTEPRRVRMDDNRWALPRFNVPDCDGEAFGRWLSAIFPENERSVEESAAAGPRVLVAGWFSFEDGHATAGDLLARDLACDWIRETGGAFDIAVSYPFKDGVDWRRQDPGRYSHVVFVCGPYGSDDALVRNLFDRFRHARRIGLNLTMLDALDRPHSFDRLFERDSAAVVRPDIVFGSPYLPIPVVGVCLVEDYDGADTARANRLIEQLLAEREMSVVRIDTRLDANGTGLRTPAEIEALIARMDVVITTRLHGLVLALKHGRPVVAIDPELGGLKLRRQAEAVGWPIIFDAETVDLQRLRAGLQYCLSSEAAAQAQHCRDRALPSVEQLRSEFIAALKAS